jgi:hypothetical protein
VTTLAAGSDGDAVAGFERLVGMPLARYEPLWRARIAAIRGSAAGQPVRPAR